MRLIVPIMLAIMLCAMCSIIAVSPSYAAGESAEDSPEYQMAILNAGRWVNKNDVTIVRFRFLLSSIQEKSGYSTRRIGDMVAKMRDMIRSEYGKEVNLLAFTEEVNRVVRTAPKGMKLEEIVAMLAISIGRS